MSTRRRLPLSDRSFAPRYVVWELTLRCDHACAHCGSRAALARDDELSTAEALDVARQLAEAGAREVVLIGGEAYLHEGFLEVVRELASRGVVPVLTTGGKGVSRALARAMREAGLARVSVSVDGLAPTHDRLRAQRGSFERALAAMAASREAGLRVSVNTNVNRLNQGELEPLYERLRDEGAFGWQVQLTTPLGRAADRPELVLQPFDLLTLVPRLARLKERALADGVALLPGNNLGYFGPEEALLRSPERGGRDHFQGCQAGRHVLGIESHGAVKGCPSLQSDAYVAGSLREQPLATLWREAPRLAFARQRTRGELWGLCRTCDFADVCKGGCTFTAHALFGRPGNDPYCHHRALVLARRGLRERLVPVSPAPGRPFDHGLFEAVLEPLDAPDPGAERSPDERLRPRRHLPLAEPAGAPSEPA